MTKAQAMKLAHGKWGKRAAVRDRPRASTREKRAEASASLKQHRAEKPNPVTRDWQKREDQLISAACSYRFDVGYGSWAFFIQGSGDSWEEACRAAGLLAKGAE